MGPGLSPPAPLRGSRLSGSVKQVTKSNFAESLQQIAKHIRDADYIAVSVQKTGAAFPSSSSASSFPSGSDHVPPRRNHHPWWHRVSSIDTVDTAYLKAKVAAERFQLLQVAVCPFRLHGSKVIAHPFNFHLFPRDELNIGMPSYSFSCQTSSISSMAREGYDFNLCIYDGLSYLSRVQESIAKHRSPIPKIHSTSTVTSVADTIFMEKIKLRTEQWRSACLNSNPSEDALVRSLRKLLRGGDVYGSRPCLNIDVCNHRQVQLVAQVLGQSFDSLVPLITPDKGGDEVKEVKVVLTSSEDDRNLLLDEIQSLEEENDKKARGFREVIDMIASSHKPVITYNALNEFTFIHSKFIGPLPSSMAEFMCSLRLVFPSVIDVNYLLKQVNALKKVNSMPAAVSHVSRLFFVPVEIEIPEKASNKTGKKHGHLALRITSLFAKLSLLLKVDPSGHANVFPPFCTALGENEEEDPGDVSDDVRKVTSSNVIFLWGLDFAGPTEELRNRLRGSHAAFSGEFDLAMVGKSCAVVVFWNRLAPRALIQDIESGRISGCHLAEMISQGMRVAGYDAYRKACRMGLWERDLADSLDRSLLEDVHRHPLDGGEKSRERIWNDELAIHLDEL